MRYNLLTQNRIKVARDMKLNVFVGVLKGKKKSFSYFSFTGCNVSVAEAGSTSPSNK